MVNDLVALFEKAYKEYGDKMILDIYKPKEGLYLKINEDGSIEKLVIDKNTSKDDLLYQWFREKDYFSSLIDMNKPVDPKKQIHSNNYYTVFIKKDVFPDIGKGDKVLDKSTFVDIVDKYFEILKDPLKKYKDKNTLALFETLDLHVDPDYDALKNYIKNNYDLLINILKTENFNNYIKLFYNKDTAFYVRESRKYFVPKIFNNNDYNVKIGDAIYGLSNNNMGMNSKKPYLENKSTKYKVPYRVDIRSAIIGKKIFDWINYQDGSEVYIPEGYNFTRAFSCSELDKKSCFYLHFTRGAEVTIDDFEAIPFLRYKIDFTLYNYLGLTGKEDNVEYVLDDMPVSTLDDLEKEVNRKFFNGRLIRSYYEVQSVKGNEFSKNMQNLLVLSRKAFHSYFRKSIDIELKSIIDHLSMEIVKELISTADSSSFFKAADALNLRLSFLNYFKVGGWDMGDKIEPLIRMLMEKASSKDEIAVCRSDDEFYFACGQLARYLLSKSKASNKTYSLVEPFLRAKTGRELKKQLTYVFDTYKHAVPMDFDRFKRIMSAVQGYDADTGMERNEDFFLAGFLSNNIFYMKSKED